MTMGNKIKNIMVGVNYNEDIEFQLHSIKH